MKTVLTIKGMHCVNCAARLQKALAAAQGVETAQVEISTNTATIQFNEAETSIAQLTEVVKNCGFSVENN